MDPIYADPQPGQSAVSRTHNVFEQTKDLLLRFPIWRLTCPPAGTRQPVQLLGYLRTTERSDAGLGIGIELVVLKVSGYGSYIRFKACVWSPWNRDHQQPTVRPLGSMAIEATQWRKQLLLTKQNERTRRRLNQRHEQPRSVT